MAGRGRCGGFGEFNTATCRAPSARTSCSTDRRYLLGADVALRGSHLPSPR